MPELKSTPSQGRELEVRVPAGDTATVELTAGQFLNIATEGGPVVGSLFAFASDDRSEWLSMGNTRILLGRLRPRPGDRLYSNRRRTFFVWAADSGGGHDLLMPPCATDSTVHVPALERLGCALARIEVDHTCTPDPLNLFLESQVQADGRIHLRPSADRPGYYVMLRATAALHCAILAWSMADARPDAGAALAVRITNERTTPELAAEH